MFDVVFISTHTITHKIAKEVSKRYLFRTACQRSLAIVQAFWYNGEKEDRREEEWNSGSRITGETW